MGRIVINETENKQTIILNDSPEGVEGGYFDSNMVWNDFEGGGGTSEELTRDMAIGSVTKYVSGAHANEVIDYTATNRVRIPLPIKNPGKIVPVDPVNYDIIGFGVTSLDWKLINYSNIWDISFSGVSSETDLNWKKSVETDAEYVWFAIRKTDNSDFTQADLANPLNRLYKIED